MTKPIILARLVSVDLAYSDNEDLLSNCEALDFQTTGRNLAFATSSPVQKQWRR